MLGGHDSKVHSQSLITHVDSENENLNMLNKVIEDLRWKLDYEKKLNKEMIELLEKKVSTLLAQINNYQEEAVEAKQKLEVQEHEIEFN